MKTNIALIALAINFELHSDLYGFGRLHRYDFDTIFEMSFR